MLPRLKLTQKDYSLNQNGMSYILELFFMEENTAPQEDGILTMTL
jgi:hypothetical protein